MRSAEQDPTDVESYIVLVGKKMSSLKTVTSSTSEKDRRFSFFFFFFSFFKASVEAFLVTNH